MLYRSRLLEIFKAGNISILKVHKASDQTAQVLNEQGRDLVFRSKNIPDKINLNLLNHGGKL
jgi:hypothetical protein